MKKKILKNLALVSSFAVLCSALSACAGTGSGAASSGTGQSSAVRTASTAAAAAGASSAGRSSAPGTGSSVTASGDTAVRKTESAITSSGDTAVLKTGLENAGFTVSEGTFYEFDTVEMASQGKLSSCFGNNAGSAYTIVKRTFAIRSATCS